MRSAQLWFKGKIAFGKFHSHEDGIDSVEASVRKALQCGRNVSHFEGKPLTRTPEYPISQSHCLSPTQRRKNTQDTSISSSVHKCHVQISKARLVHISAEFSAFYTAENIEPVLFNVGYLDKYYMAP